MNSNLIRQGVNRDERLDLLVEIAQNQLSTLNRITDDKKSLKKINERIYIENKQVINHNKKIKK